MRLSAVASLLSNSCRALARAPLPFPSPWCRRAPSRQIPTRSSSSSQAPAQAERRMEMEKQRVVSEPRVLGKSRWLQLLDVTYTRGGQEHSWQYVERTTKLASGEVDAVCIFAVVRKPGEPASVIIVKQFRPPVNRLTVELPAGLVDPGETAEQAALRELKEETGYVGKIIHSGGVQYLSPGLTNECVKTIFVEVDAANQTLQAPDDAGFIAVETVPLASLSESLARLEAEGYAVWVGLHSIAQAFKLQSIIGSM